MSRSSRPQREGRSLANIDRQDRRRAQILLPTLLLLLLGLGASLYLGDLWLEVHGSSGGEAVDSFCALSAEFDCVTVATSEYSTFLGLPVALYGIELFLACIIGVVLSATRKLRVRAWDSVMFYVSALCLPVCAVLAVISFTRIRSVCIMCLTVYGVIAALFLILLLSGAGRWRELFTAGPREVGALVRRPAGALAVALVVVVALSQPAWVPSLLRDSDGAGGPDGAAPWQGLPTDGLSIGPADAPVQIHEFTDFQCPFCGRAHQVMMTVLRQMPGKIRLIHRDYPLDVACHPMIRQPMHPNACEAALVARCAARQDKYWPLEALLFANRDRLAAPHLREYAREVGLDLPQLERCLADPATEAAIQKDIAEGMQLKITGTPAYVVNGELVMGLRNADFWVAKVKQKLAQKR